VTVLVAVAAVFIKSPAWPIPEFLIGN
jgi:hypothetical protein